MRRVPPAASDLFVPCVLALLAVAAGSSALAAPRDTDSYRVLAGVYSRKDVKSGAGNPVARAALGELTIAVEYLEPGARAAFVRSIAPAMPDPFAVRPGRPEMYSAFRVSFNNRSGSDVQFQPKNVVLLTDRKTQDFPVDLTDLYRGAEMAGLSDPERVFDRLAPIVFDSGTTIARGKSLERLLVFGPFPAKWRDLQLHFSFLQIGTETRTVSFNFHKQPSKE
jgi:hypothetical protein